MPSACRTAYEFVMFKGVLCTTLFLFFFSSCLSTRLIYLSYQVSSLNYPGISTDLSWRNRSPFLHKHLKLHTQTVHQRNVLYVRDKGFKRVFRFYKPPARRFYLLKLFHASLTSFLVSENHTSKLWLVSKLLSLVYSGLP